MRKPNKNTLSQNIGFLHAPDRSGVPPDLAPDSSDQFSTPPDPTLDSTPREDVLCIVVECDRTQSGVPLNLASESVPRESVNLT